MKRKPYEQYSREFKFEAVRLAEADNKPATRVPRELGIRMNQLGK
jgi:transposase-like protein